MERSVTPQCSRKEHFADLQLLTYDLLLGMGGGSIIYVFVGDEGFFLYMRALCDPALVKCWISANVYLTID